MPFIHYYNVRAVRTLREKPLSRHHWHSGTGTCRAGQGTPPGCQKLRRCQTSAGGKGYPIMASLLYLSVLLWTGLDGQGISTFIKKKVKARNSTLIVYYKAVSKISMQHFLPPPPPACCWLRERTQAPRSGLQPRVRELQRLEEPDSSSCSLLQRINHWDRIG